MMKTKIPNIGIVIGYDCPKCGISGIRRKQKSCCKCGLEFDWNPYKNAEQISVRRVKEILLNTDFERIKPEYAGKAKYYNGVFLSVKKT